MYQDPSILLATVLYWLRPMNPLIGLSIHLLVAAFVVGCVGCAILIPVVAFKFVAVLFEPDPPSEPATVQDLPSENLATNRN
jgi:hypothetical protein